MTMTIEEIKALVQMVEDSGIAELEVQQGQDRVRIRRNAKPRNQEIVLPTMVPMPIGSTVAAAPITTVEAASAATESAAAAPVEEKVHTVSVKSPIVGTYYDSPSPGSPAFVKVGDTVYPKQVLCIIESMKLMNEIEAELSGIVVAKAVENGRPVEYGELLFTIQPL
jgi:acetyl-CoA carboxylase biotin carboxyl carrier protein